jgi:surfeit locus 1 family protein
MVLALAATILLGVWQYHVWQAGRAAQARDISDAKPLALDTVMGGDSAFPGKYLGQPVTFSGTWLPKGTLYVSDRELHGRRGYWVMTPVLIGKSAMPVVRGWSAKPEAPAPSGQVAVQGWLQASEGSDVDDPNPDDDIIPEMRIASVVEHVDADLYSGYVVAKAVSTSSTSESGSAGLEKVTPASIPQVSAVDHLRNLLYAFQWWVFGGFAIYIWVRWCRDEVEAAAAPVQTVAG